MANPKIVQQIDFIVTADQLCELLERINNANCQAALVSHVIIDNGQARLALSPLKVDGDADEGFQIKDKKHPDNYIAACPIPPDCQGTPISKICEDLNTQLSQAVEVQIAPSVEKGFTNNGITLLW